jgi:excisionase family DNA binding protein
MDKSKKPYTTGEIASFCHVTINAVKKWIASGKLNAYRTPGGHYRVDRDDFEAFISSYRLHIKPELFPGKKKVLIIDDEPQVVEYLRGALESSEDGYKYDIETAGDGYEALIKAGYFNPDLLILDIRMPRIDGFEVCRRLRKDEKTKSIKILAITAFGREDMEKILKSGADKCLSKPINLKEFQMNVEKLLR